MPLRAIGERPQEGIQVQASGAEKQARPRVGKRQAESLRAYMKLFRASSAITGRIAAVLVEHGLTMTQYNVLDTLLHKGDMRQRELSGKVMKSDGNLTVVQVNLENMALVERTRAEGTRRDLTVSLTPAGRRKILHVFPIFAATVAEQMRVLSLEDLQLLGELCKRAGLGAQVRG
jgi:MarR family 2-MHQ and catechol resistance regulon transcriptional repressor